MPRDGDEGRRVIMEPVGFVNFPAYTEVRCLMMPYVQGEPESVPSEYHGYSDIIASTFICKGDVGYLTIDESTVRSGKPHRGQRAKTARALHTEAGMQRGLYAWGPGPVWGGRPKVTLEPDVQVLLANSLDRSCALWDATHADTTDDGDIGHEADRYPYNDAVMMLAGEVFRIGILTPHESLPVRDDCKRQFLRIVGSGVYGREPYFTRNPLMPL